MTENMAPIYNSRSDELSVQIPAGGIEETRPPMVKAVSSPSYQSPLRHQRNPRTRAREIKTTLNAKSEYSNSEDDGTAQHRINQYIIKQEIGRGSFGAVHLAVDQFGQEYAVKEFSKSRLRKRAQSNLLRGSAARRRLTGMGFNTPMHRHDSNEQDNAFDLIKEEIAIMKKLHHPNLVSLIEVLDDPTEDSLYMVMEMCKKGVVMKVGLDETADPYEEEQCRIWFRDLILGIEYLHSQGVVHRDIKPDNCLITSDDVLKVVDFGVSEMFEKQSEMQTTKSAGSPAFMPPELCVARHGPVSGRACDIWSMGVTLYCLRHGRIPFLKNNILDLYESISRDGIDFADDCQDDIQDLFKKILEKDPEKRIKMDELREHPWVTNGGEDPLPTKDENCSEPLEPPTEEEINTAITGNMRHLMTVVKAVKRFKTLLVRKRPGLIEGIFGRASRIVQPPLSIDSQDAAVSSGRSKSVDIDDRRPIEGALTAEGLHRDLKISDDLKRVPKAVDMVAIPKQDDTASATGNSTPSMQSQSRIPAALPFRSAGAAASRNHSRAGTGKGQAHDPLLDHLFLNIGIGLEDEDCHHDETYQHPISESPKAVDINVFQTAYEEEVEKILASKRSPTLYLTRRVEESEELRNNEHVIDFETPEPAHKAGLAKLLATARERMKEDTGQESPDQGQSEEKET